MQRTRILLVESQVGIKSAVSDLLEQMGYSVMGPHCSVSGARQIAAITRPDLTVMELHLRHETSLIFGDEPARQGIPVVYLIDNRKEHDAALASGRRGLLKPLDARHLRSVLADINAAPLQVA